MSSLRLALKLSLQENPDAAPTERQPEPFESLDAIVGRKRKGSLDKKEPRPKKPKDESTGSKSRGKNGEDGNSVAGDSFTSMGLNADEASVSSHALNKDDEIMDDDAPPQHSSSTQQLSSSNIESGDNLKSSVAVDIVVKAEKTSEESVPDDREERSGLITSIKAEDDVDASLVVESEDKQEEVTSPRKAGGKKKRLLRGLDVTEKDVADALMEADEDGPRYQSNRAAAMVAKTKLNVATASAASVGKILSNDATVSAAANNSAVKEPSRRGGWNRGGGRGAANARLTTVVIEWVQCDKCEKWRSVAPSIDIQSLPDEWICTNNNWDDKYNVCDAPEQTEEEAKAMYAEVTTSMGPPAMELPRIRRETSDASGSVTETPSRPGYGDGDGDHDALVGGTGGRGHAGGRGGGRGGRGGGRGGRRGTAQYASNAPVGSDDSGNDDDAPPSTRTSRRQVNYAEDDENNAADGYDRSGRSTQKRRSGFGAGGRNMGGRGSARDLNASFAAVEEVAVSAVQWVQCNKCSKWRKVAESVDANALPEVWFCHMNHWNPATARCNAKQETDDPADSATATPGRGNSGGRYGAGGAGGRGNSNHHAIIQAMINANAAAMAAAANAPPLAPGEIKRIQWVQCERRNCQKWRKVPAYMDMTTFPAKWYCDMNFWSPERAYCDVAEDVDSDEERKKKEVRNNRNLLLGSNKGNAQLSYRRIIYGNDAKVRPHFAEKSKMGNGIFTYPIPSRKVDSDDEEEQYFHSTDGLEPVRRVAYWWSTSFDDRLHGLHTNSIPATFTANASTSATTADGPAGTVKQEASQDNFVLSSATAVSANANMAEKPKASYMIDTARKLYQEATGVVSSAWTEMNNHDKKALQAIEKVNSLTLYQRMNMETTVIRTLLMSTNQVHVLFISLMQLLSQAQFLDPVCDGCRYLLIEQTSAVIDILHRMEEKNEIEVGYTRDHQLVITLLPSIDTLKQELASRRSYFDQQFNATTKARQFDPRQRKCFQQKYAHTSSALSAIAVATVSENVVSDATLKAVAVANNIPVRTAEDGSFLSQYPTTGPNKIIHSSVFVPEDLRPIIPQLTPEEIAAVTEVFNGGKEHRGGNQSSAGTASGVFQPSANVPGGSGPGGRGRRGGGGGGRGRGRGRGAANAVAADGSIVERPGGGRGAAKRAAKAAAEAIARVAAEASGIAMDVDSSIVEKKSRKPYTKRKLLSPSDEVVSSIRDASSPDALAQANSAKEDTKGDEIASSSSSSVVSTTSSHSKKEKLGDALNNATEDIEENEEEDDDMSVGGEDKAVNDSEDSSNNSSESESSVNNGDENEVDDDLDEVEPGEIEEEAAGAMDIDDQEVIAGNKSLSKAQRNDNDENEEDESFTGNEKALNEGTKDSIHDDSVDDDGTLDGNEESSQEQNDAHSTEGKTDVKIFDSNNTTDGMDIDED